MTTALTEKTWLRTLDRIINSSPNDTTRTLAAMLSDIISNPSDLPDILDTWGSKLSEGM